MAVQNDRHASNDQVRNLGVAERFEYLEEVALRHRETLLGERTSGQLRGVGTNPGVAAHDGTQGQGQPRVNVPGSFGSLAQAGINLGGSLAFH